MQINNAMASLPSAGGKVIIQTQSTGQCYSFTVPIVITKAVILEGQGPSTCIQFVGMGSAINISGNLPSFMAGGTYTDGFGLRDLTLLGSGPGAGQTGLEIGGETNSVGFYGSGLTIGSFGLGLRFDRGVWNFKIEHSIFALNGQNVYWPSSLHFGGENIEFDSVTFTGSNFINSLEFNDPSTTDFSNLMNLTFVSCNFDDAQLVINNGSGSVRLYSPHFENPRQSSGTEPFVRIQAFTTASDVLIDGPDFYNDQNNPYPPAFLEIDGSPTVTISQMRSVNLDGSTNVPTNILIAGDAKLTLLGNAPLRAAQQQYVVASGNPTLWVMGGEDTSNNIQSQSPLMYSQTYSSADNQSPVVEIGGSGYQPTIGFDLWTGVGSSYYGMQIKESGPGELDFCSAGAGALNKGTYVCNAGIVNGVFTNTVPDGTAPLSVSSHTPPNNLNAWPATFAPNGSQIQNPHITTGKVILPSSGQDTVLFNKSAQFSQTPSCTISYQTSGPLTGPRSLSSNPYPNRITIFGQPYIGVYYICVGN
ncbi:MAG: hypothetical protein P4L40_09490 [Terracidiphilus sp.]|nr:hypothetical protein [Terracidiphilus sp.]